MKVDKAIICPDLECNEVYLDNGNGCPRCLSSEGIPLRMILTTIEELGKLTTRKHSNIIIENK